MPEVLQPIEPTSPDTPNAMSPMNSLESPEDSEGSTIVRAEILKRIDDSLQIEKDWRNIGQKIQQIYRGELDASGVPSKGTSRFNSLNSNVCVLLPSLFSRSPKADIRARSPMSDPFINQACDIMEQIADIILQDQSAFECIRKAVKENLLPGRGIVRVRWDPIVETTQVPGNNNTMLNVHEKLLDQVELEHVYWEDFTYEQTSDWKNTGWIAFRHLMTEKVFMGYFADVPIVQQWIAAGKKDEIFRWTDKMASRAREYTGTVTQGQRDGLQDTIMKAMVWEFWDKSTREVVWICQDMAGNVLSIDPDPYKLRNFFPCPRPLTAVTTTDQQLPVPEYTIYQDLASEVDTLSQRIAAIAKRIKVVGAYNGSQEHLASILKQEDGEMTAVNGLDIEFDLKKHVWLLDIQMLVQSLQALYLARNEAKQAMYEVTGISDIVRGQTRASETLGAQRIKSQFAALRIEDRKRDVEAFSLGIIEIISEIVAEHFSPESIFFFTGIQVYPETMQVLQNDAMRISRIDVETDSTVTPDETAEQQSMSAMLQALGFVLQQVGPMVVQGIMPMPIAIELVKLAVSPFKGSRRIDELLDQYMQMISGGQLGMMGPMGQPGQTPPMPGAGAQPAQIGAPA